jgi:hypothetical protein
VQKEKMSEPIETDYPFLREWLAQQAEPLEENRITSSFMVVLARETTIAKVAKVSFSTIGNYARQKCMLQKLKGGIMSKERPIIFTTESVRAILSGKKTQTRRVIKPQPIHWYDGEGTYVCDTVGKCYLCPDDNGNIPISPFGVPGDRLWVREGWSYIPYDLALTIMYKADYLDDDFITWRSPLYMKRQYSRLLLEVTAVRVERLRDMPPHDAIAEGYDSEVSFSIAWNEINSKRGFAWADNPYVWVVEFKKIEPK